jgi:hypothetical protein
VARWVPGRWHREGPRGLPAGSARPGLCRLRVYYDVEEDPEQQVNIVAIGMKRRNRVSIGGELYDI